MAINISGRGGQLNYIGVEAPTPPNFTRHNRPPNSNDSQNVRIGDFWLNQELNAMWVLVSLALGIATWIPFGNAVGILTETPDTGDIVSADINSNINVLGAAGSGISTFGVESTHTIYIGTTSGFGVVQSLTGNSGGPVYPDGTGTINTIGGSTINPAINQVTYPVIGTVGNAVANTLKVNDLYNYQLTLITSDATPTIIFSYTLPVDGVLTITGNIIGVKADFTGALTGEFTAGALNDAGTTTLIGAPVISYSQNSLTGTPALDVTVTGNNLNVLVTGEADIDYAWTLYINVNVLETE